MQQKIIIKNLGPIKDCEIEINPFTVFIGESGSGKSIILRTISMCKWIYKKMQYSNLLKKSHAKQNAIRFRLDRLLRDSVLDDFFSNDSYIEFFVNNKSIIVIEKNKLKPNYKNMSSKFMLSKIVFLNENRTVLPEILSTPGGRKAKFSYYTDDMIENFYIAFDEIGNGFKLNTIDIELFSKKAVGFNQIFIKRDNKNIKLEHASSGEKNTIVLELILTYYLSKYNLIESFKSNIKSSIENLDLVLTKKLFDYVEAIIEDIPLFLLTVFIEEPETNLFPINQKKLIYFLVLVASMKNKMDNSEIIFSTHSPYMLTAINNLLYASQILKSKPELKEKIYEIVGEKYILENNDLSVYMIENGTANSIIDTETNLINADSIDSVSSDILNDFEKLYELENS